jgi:hypothetical protein
MLIYITLLLYLAFDKFRKSIRVKGLAIVPDSWEIAILLPLGGAFVLDGHKIPIFVTFEALFRPRWSRDPYSHKNL